MIENGPVRSLVGAYVSSSARETSKLPEVLNSQQTPLTATKNAALILDVMKYKHQSISRSSKISDDELIRRLTELLTKSRRVEAELVAHNGEVDSRRLYASKASSMFVYSTEVLNFSEHEAYLRITVARAARRHPILLEMLADGSLHLSGIAKLVPVLTETNRETLLARAVHQSKRKIEELVAELSPKPDVPATMRKLPEGTKKNTSHKEPTRSENELGAARSLNK